MAGLGLLGGEAKRDFVLELMRTTRDKNLRQTALRACIRMEANNEEMHSGLAGFCACHTVVSMDASDKLESIRLILLSCGDPDGPTQEEELRAFAIAHDISNAEMSSMLIELAGPGLAAHAEPLQRELVDGVLWGLGCFGGAKEKEFVRNVMRTSRDSHLQKAAVRVGIRMMPEGWEEWVREVVSDKRYDEMVRFDAYEEAFRRRKNKEACRRSLVESHWKGTRRRESGTLA